MMSLSAGVIPTITFGPKRLDVVEFDRRADLAPEPLLGVMFENLRRVHQFRTISGDFIRTSVGFLQSEIRPASGMLGRPRFTV